MQHGVVLRALIYYNKRIQSRISKGKMCIGGDAQRNPSSSFQESSPSGVTQDMFNSSSKKSWQHVCSVVYQGSTLEIRCPVFLLGPGHIGLLLLTKYWLSVFQTSRSKADVQHKPYSLCKPSRHSESFLSVLGLVRTLLKSKSPEAIQVPTLQVGLSKKNNFRTATFTLFCPVGERRTAPLKNAQMSLLCSLAFWCEIL